MPKKIILKCEQYPEERYFYSEDGYLYVEFSRLYDPEWDVPLSKFDPWHEIWEENAIPSRRANLAPARKKLVLTRDELNNEPHKELLEIVD